MLCAASARSAVERSCHAIGRHVAVPTFPVIVPVVPVLLAGLSVTGRVVVTLVAV